MSKRKRTHFMALEPVSVAMGEAKEPIDRCFISAMMSEFREKRSGTADAAPLRVNETILS